MTMSHLDREIASQPKTLARLFDKERKPVEKLAVAIRQTGLKHIFLVARGSSDNAGLYGKYLFGARNRFIVSLATPSLFTLYGRPPDLRDSLVLAISQSGESDDLCHVMQEAKAQGAASLVLCNYTKSPLASLARWVFPLHAGVERSVAATKTYTAELLALAMLSVALDGTAKDWKELRRVPALLDETLEMNQAVAAQASRYRYADRMAVIGRGFNYATAFELALKLKELAYLAAEPSSSADFRHGPIAVVGEGFPVLLIAPKGKTLADMRELAGELRKRRAEILAISNDAGILRMAQCPMPIPADLPEWLSPLVCAVPGQLLARHVANVRDCPLDKPRGLRKVTRTL